VARVHFDEGVAAAYDERAAALFTPEVIDPTVDLLTELAAGGAALELGVGTGRVAIPLGRRGVAVHGIDNSAPMVERLRAKPGGSAIRTTIGDFATTTVDGTFALAFVVDNTIENLTTQDAQVECFANVGRHLAPGGFFLVEVLVPDLQRLPLGARFRAFDVSPTHVGVDEIDVATQTLRSHHYFIDDGRVALFSPPFRYVWPSELDLMARLAGMALWARWGGWRREPFDSNSTMHVSVWQTPG
jgi:SAM-dependent methyltransferase